MPERIHIQPEVLKWAISASQINKENLISQFNKIDSWITGDEDPTINQAIQLSNKLRVPFGYLLLESPPIEEIPIVEFRTIESKEINNPSRELIDTIKDMENKQNWMQEYLIQEGFGKNMFSGREDFREDLNPQTVATNIRELIDLNINWYNSIRTKDEAYNYLKKKISNSGVMVMQSGVALHNTRRQLDLSEFRAFALSHEYAPLIFINIRDTLSGKIFSLLHELVHIYFGISSFYNADGDTDNQFVKPIEQLCNSVAAELLVPISDFQTKWQSYSALDLEEKLSTLERTFKVSKIVIARRALILNYINNETYTQISKDIILFADQRASSSSGGNSIETYQSRIDHNFIKAISTGLKSGRATYSDIYKLTGLRVNTFSKVEKLVESRGGE